VDASNILRGLVSITQFNKGQAAKIFDRLKTGRSIVVLNNNAPSALLFNCIAIPIDIMLTVKTTMAIPSYLPIHFISLEAQNGMNER
jgi:hypothetical protein